MRLIINGAVRELIGPESLQKFLEDIDVNVHFIAVAYNGEVIPRGEFPNVILTEGDHLEIVHPMGGG